MELQLYIPVELVRRIVRIMLSTRPKPYNIDAKGEEEEPELLRSMPQ